MSELVISVYQNLVELYSAIKHEGDVPFGGSESELLEEKVFEKWIKQTKNKLLILQKKLVSKSI